MSHFDRMGHIFVKVCKGLHCHHHYGEILLWSQALPDCQALVAPDTAPVMNWALVAAAVSVCTVPAAVAVPAVVAEIREA